MDSDGGADAGVDRLIVDAHEAGIRVLDMGSALMDYPVRKAADRLADSAAAMEQPPTREGWWDEERGEYVPLHGAPRSDVKIVPVYLDESSNTWQAAA